MNELDFPIPRIQVEEQLQRILLSKRFANATNPADFLRFVVFRKLDGKQSPSRVIAAELFKGKYIQGVSSDVRVTASNLRKTLDRYYLNEGMGDFVRITFPQAPEDRTIPVAEGEPYTPIFDINPFCKVVAGLAGAYSLLARGTYGEWAQALKIFDAIANENPLQMGAQLGLIETLCKFKQAGWKNPDDAPIEDYCSQTFAMLEEAGNKYWRYWAVRAFYESLYGVDKAADAYRKALDLDKRKTEDYVEYIDFLITIGHHEVATLLALRWFNPRAGDSVSLVRIAAIFMRIEMIEQAITTAETALMLDSGSTGAHGVMLCLALVREDHGAFDHHMRYLELLLDELSLQFVVQNLRDSAKSAGREDVLDRILANRIIASSGEAGR